MADNERPFIRDYTWHQWTIGESITQDKMSRIEQAIDSAFYILNNEKASTSNLSTLTSNIDSRLNDFQRIIQNANTNAQNALNAAGDGTNAWGQLLGAGVTENLSLGSILDNRSSAANAYTDGKIGEVITTINGIDGRVTTVETSASNATSAITVIQNILDGIKGNADDSAAARINRMDSAINANAQAINTLSTGGRGSYNSLAERLDAIDNSTTGFRTLPAVDTEVINARGKDANNNAYLNLAARLNAGDTEVATVRGIAEAAIPQTKINHTLTSTDATQVLGADQGPAITTAISNAENSAVQTANGYADQNKIAKTSIFNGLNQDANTTGTVLDARQGAALNTRLTAVEGELNDAHIAGGATSLDARFDSIDGGSAPSRTLPNLITEVENARTSHAVQYNNDGTMTDTTYASLDERLEAIETAQESNNTALDTRISALETEVDMTSASSRIDVIESNVNGAKVENGPQTLDARFDAVEGRATTLESNVHAIATELAMLDNQDAIKNTNTKIDDLEADVQALASELEMGQDSNGRLVGAESRIDDIEGEINAAHRTSGDTLDARFDSIDSAISHAANVGTSDPGGLTERITAVESDLDTATTGVKARITSLETTVNTTTTGLVDKVATIENDLNTTTTGLKDRVTALENEPKSATVIIDNTCITYNTVNDETVPTIYTTSEKTTAITPTEDADYLLQGASPDTKYYYWKYIGTAPNGSWELISGGGGSGTGSSSGEFAASLASIAAPDENIDYFVGNNVDGYIHYRYIPAADPNETGVFVQILPKNLVNSLGVASINVTTADATDTLPAVVSPMSGGLLAYNLGDNSHATNLLNNFTALRYVRLKTTYEEDGITLKKQELIFTDTTGNDMAPIEIKGGGGGSTDYNIRLIDVGGATSFMAPASNDAVTTLTLKPIVNYGNTIAEGVTINVNVQYKLSTEADSEYKNASITIPAITNNSNFNLNVSSLLGDANTTTDIKVTATTQPDGDEGAIYTKSITYHVTTVTMTIESIGFDQAAIRNGNSFDFSYKCIGYDLSKVVTFIIDNGTPITEDIGKSHNEERSKAITLAGLQDGMHTLQVYYSVGSAKSNILNYYFIYNSDATRTAPIVAVAGANATIHYGDDLTINYTVYTPGQERTDEVDIEVYRLDGATEISVGSFSQANVPNSTVVPFTIPEYPLNESQYTIYARVTARKNGTPVLSDTATAAITVLPADFDYQLKYADPENKNLLFMYNAAGKSNNDVNKEVYKHRFTPKDGNDPFDFTATFSNFNWATNGYIADKTTGENALVISGGANCAINVPVFNRTYSYTPTGASEPISVSIESDTSNTSINTRGRTVELDYEVVSTVDANSTIIECMGANGAGIKVTPQSCYLVNSTTSANISQDSSGFINNESSIAAAYLSTGQRIHLVFVIEPEATTESPIGGYHQCVNIYVNGEFANSQPYTRGTVFSSDATMTIGNATSLIKLYSIRMYNRGFSDSEVLQNYMMAPSKINDKLARFEANNVLDSKSGLISYSKAMKKYNCLLLTGIMSPYKGSPSTIRFDGVDSQGNPIPVGKRESALVLTKPNAQAQSGYVTEFELYDKLNDGGYASSNNVQGTSSQKYPIHNLKVYLAKGDDTNQQVFDTSINISVKKIYKYSVNTAALAAYNSVYPSAVSTPDYIKNCADEVSTIIKNLAVVPTQAEVVEKIEEYLAAEDTDVSAAYSTYSTSDELITHPTLTYKKAKKVKYQLNGPNSIGESTLCWKADYMSTDHANTYNANMANGLFTYKLPSQDTDQGGDSKVQNTVKGIRCLLFVRSDIDSAPVFIGDGCLNNDKGNNKTFGLEHSSDDGNDTLRQKWEFTNNSEGLCLFKTDHLYEMITTGEGANQKTEMRAKGGFESTYPDEGDLEEEGLTPNYTHLQILLTWVYQRANFWDASTTVETTEVNGQTVGAYLYNGIRYNTEQAYRKAIFLNEFNRHFVLNHVLTYYLFSEFIALCDNRAKNMFLRCDNVRSEQIKLASDNTQLILDGNEFGDDGTLWNQLVTPNTGVVDASMIDWETSTFAVWAPVLYDLDSCYGVENVGYLTIPYDADWYYNLKGWNKNQISKAQIDNPNQDQIGFQFSGVASRLWLMVEEAYGSNIQELAKTLYSRDDGLNYYNVYTNQIEDNLIETSPALVNQDMILKFQNPWETGFIDYSQKPPVQSTEVYKYLQRGTKTSQKDSFVYRRSTLLSSKYQADSFIKGSINFRTNVSVPDTELDKTSITITANQMIYPAVTYGDNKAPISSATKIAANTPYTFQATAEVGATDTIHIAGGAVLTDIGDLSKWSPYEVKVGLGANLKRLILGKKDAGYENLKLDRLDLTNCQLLETINVENCKALEELDVSKNGLIKEIYTFASNIKRVIIPNGGVLTTLQLGSKITEIKIQNQSYLTNFIYEGQNDVNITNPYSSVNTLWIENTPNIPIVDIIMKNAAGLTGGIRLEGINLTLTSEQMRFLDILISPELMNGKYINSNGETDSNYAYPHITGTITVTSIRRSVLNALNAHYSQLTINVTGTITEEFEINYWNYNKTQILYTDHKTDEADSYYIDPVVETNPVTGNPYITSIPTKPQDAAKKYYFGEYDNDGAETPVYTLANYIEFTGWLDEDTNTVLTAETNVRGATNFIARFPTTEDQYYKVRWFDEPTNSVPLQTIEAKYGTDISLRTQPEESNTFVRAKYDNNNHVYKVFKGWDCPVGTLVKDLDIYAVWETSALGNSVQASDIVMNQLNAADLYALSRLNADTRERVFGSHLNGIEPIKIRMGHDLYYRSDSINTADLISGAEKITLNGQNGQVRRTFTFDGESTAQEIKPMLDINSDWTIAIDYKFIVDSALFNSSREFVLLSCYSNVNSAVQGFKVSLNKAIQVNDPTMSVYVTWGTTTSEVIDTINLVEGASSAKQYCRSYRNVLVLRHSQANPNNLYIYTTGHNGDVYSTASVPTQTLTYTSSSINSPLLLGGTLAGSSSDIESTSSRRPCKAVIYWAKYWDADLGAKNCRLLAQWPHETEYFALTGYDNGQGNGEEEGSNPKRIIKNTQLSFAAVQGFGDRAMPTITMSDEPVGWINSSIRTFCNSRLYNAFPMSYQAIIKRTAVESNTFGNNGSKENVAETNDYIFLPSKKEIDPSGVGTSYQEAEAIKFWPWLSASNVHALQVQDDVLVDASLSTVEPLRYRFANKYIGSDTRIFYDTAIPTSVDTWVYRHTVDGTVTTDEITVRSGDVWYSSDPNANNNSSPAAYIYYTNAEINEGVYVDIITTNGGWKKAGMWDLRTIYTQDNNAMFAGSNYSYKINETGSIIAPTNNNVGQSSTRILCPEFAV